MYRASVIKSIEAVSCVIGTGATSATDAITSVTLADSILIYNGFQTPYTGPAGLVECARYHARLELTNATTVTAYRQTSDATYTVTVKGTVVQFVPGILKSVQRGTIVLAAASNTATITSVVLAKSTVMYLGNTTTFSFAGGANPVAIYQAHINVVLTNATTVTAAGGGTSGEGTVGYQVVEWK